MLASRVQENRPSTSASARDASPGHGPPAERGGPRGAAPERSIPFEGERLSRHERLRGLNDVVGALLVLEAGASSLLSKPVLPTALAWANVALGAGAAAALGWEARAGRRLGGRLSVIAVLSSALLLLDGFEQAIQGHRPGFLYMIAAGVVYVVARRGEEHGHRRRITLSSEGMAVRFSRLRRYTIPMEEVERLRISARAVAIETRRGRTRTVRRAVLPDWEAAVAEFEAWAAEQGVPVVR